MTIDNRVSGYTEDEMSAMYDEYMSTPAPPQNMSCAIAARMEEEGYSEWLVPGVLSSELTQVYGQREVGKSSYVREIIAPLSLGKPVFGIEPSTGDRPLNVLIIGTDPGAEEEYQRNLERIGHDASRVGIVYAGSGEIPQDAYDRAEFGSIDLVVIDNLAGLAPGKELNDSATAGLVFLKYEPFIRAGVPVLIVAHRGKGSGDTSAGSHQHEAKPRFRSSVSFDKSSRVLTVKGRGNLGESRIRFTADERFNLTLLDKDVPQAEETVKKDRSRSPEVLDAVDEVWQLAAESKGTSLRQVAAEVAERTGTSESTAYRRIKTGLDSGHLIKQEGQVPLLSLA